MGVDSPARPYAFDRIFAQSTIDATRTPHDLALQLHAIKAEMDQQRSDAAAELVRARADGFAAGVAQARAETAAALLSSQLALTRGIAELEAGFVATETRIAAVATEVAMAAAELLAAQAIADTPGVAIDAAVARVLAQTGFRETLHVHLHPAAAETVGMLLAARESAEQRPLTITVHEDPALAVGDAHILWDQGGLSLNAAARKAALRAALGISAPTPLTDT